MRVPGGKCGNEGRPFQGIDTLHIPYVLYEAFHVEMKVAPFRALTHTIFDGCRICDFIVEMKVAPFRALTQPALSKATMLMKSWK